MNSYWGIDHGAETSKAKRDNRDLVRGAAAGAAAGTGVATAGTGGLMLHHARKMRIGGMSYKDMNWRPSGSHLKFIGTRIVAPVAAVGAAGGLAAAGANNRSRKKVSKGLPRALSNAMKADKPVSTNYSWPRIMAHASGRQAPKVGREAERRTARALRTVDPEGYMNPVERGARVKAGGMKGRAIMQRHGKDFRDISGSHLPVSKAFLKPMAPMKPQAVLKPKAMKIAKPKAPLKPKRPVS